MLFKRFYEGDYRQHRTTGTGIGLSLVKDLVTLSHGTIEVVSEPGKGSVFIVVLPIDISFFDDSEIDRPVAQEEQEATVDKPHPDVEDALSDVKRGNLPGVLVVEDNEDICEYIAESLSDSWNMRKSI